MGRHPGNEENAATAKKLLARGVDGCRSRGQLDLLTTPTIRDRIIHLVVDGSPRPLLDLRQVTFMDSTVLGMTVGITKRVRALGGPLCMVTNLRIRTLFRITGLETGLRHLRHGG